MGLVGILNLALHHPVYSQTAVRFIPPVLPSAKESQNRGDYTAPVTPTRSTHAESSSKAGRSLGFTLRPRSERGSGEESVSKPISTTTKRIVTPLPPVRDESSQVVSSLELDATEFPEPDQKVLGTFPVPGQSQAETISIGSIQSERLQTNAVPPGNTEIPPTTEASIAAPKPLPLPMPVDKKELDKVLSYGLELERDQRWSDVLAHYEAALRSYRNDETLMQRFRFARFHYDIARRFHDSSYLKIIHTSNFIDSLNLYEEIISRIQMNYVDMPHWDDLFRYGIQDVDIALSDPTFRAKAELKVSGDKIDNYLNVMRQTAAGWEIRNREDLKNGILSLAEIAQQQIGLNPVAMLLEFTCGIVNSLDPYTNYLTPNQLNDTFSMMSGTFVGLGVELKSDRESLVIVRVITGSPAQEAGLKDGDRIYSVDGVSTKGRDTDSAADLLQGEADTDVTLQVQSVGQKVREMKVTRRKVEVPSVEDVRMLTKELGYIRLTVFQSKTCIEMKNALWSLHSRGMKMLVLDLRHNPGGLLQIGVDVANFFLEDGPIVRTRGRHSGFDTPYMATKENTWKMPLIVLIDEESASASEIVAGAIRDHNRGVIIGHRSFGKGTIQAILSINGGPTNTPQAGLRLTIEKFYSPLGLPYSGVGVTPHVLVESEKTVVARPINGQLPTPVASRTISSDPNDPFIRQAIQAAQTLSK